jgi:uncharacterized membrane protein (UPF0182 family)
LSKLNSFDKEWQQWFPEEGGENRARRGSGGINPYKIMMIVLGLVLLVIIINLAKSFYTEWLWFDTLNFGNVYTTILGVRVSAFFIAAFLFCLVFLGNLWLTIQLSPKMESGVLPGTLIKWSERTLKIVLVIATFIFALIFGLVAQSHWQTILQFFHQQPFGIADPAFNRDVSFYVFSLPYWRLIRGWLMGAFIVTLVACASVYLLSHAVQRLGFKLVRPALAHLGGMTVAILALFAWGYWLNVWDLVLSDGGLFFGAGYTDLNARIPALHILLAVVIICIVVIIISIIRVNYRWPLYSIAAWIAVAIIVSGIYPVLIQRFQVQPSELAREMPYIENNIQFTREAFGLNRVEEQTFPAEETLTKEDIDQNEGTIRNIRLWDHRPLKDTYNQIQSIRLYYDFNDVDVDRYTINNEYRQVMLSARELSAEKLAGEAQTWVNRRLQFTHGYGVALSPVNEVTPEGLPVLLEKDIPPTGDFEIKQPQIYYGEKTNDYVIVMTGTQEFDYPMGDQNVYGHYQGTGGVNIGSFLRRFIYAWQFSDFNILISNELTSQSRVLYYRNIQERVKNIAPFLILDKDPYMVIMDGGLYWIQDAYTATDRYPYSQPLNNGINYIRNSVKVVIDAYSGKVTFYVIEPDDALIGTYRSMFPGLFLPSEQMPDFIRAHMRYPEDLFSIQASVYQSYHMKDARVFYNKEDLWALPKEIYAGKEQLMEPYYVIMQLPGEEKDEFLLMMPFTPVNKNNTIGWIAARCDGDNYGKILAYHFSKEKLVYGPSQIENRIQQDTVITEQLALWGRGGSNVIRGNLLMIPLAKSSIYVEPVFLQAEVSGLPELKRVIVAIGDQIAMQPTLEESLAAIFGGGELPVENGEQLPEAAEPEGPAVPAPGPEAPVGPQSPEEVTDIAQLIKSAQNHYDKAQEYLKEGNWAGYGEEIAALKQVLDRLAELSAQE